MRIGPALLALSLLCATALRAQDSASVHRPAPDSATVVGPAAPVSITSPNVDSVALIRRPVSPMGAFWRSLLIPGWGQATLGRRTTGALFLAMEGLTLGMTLSTSSQLSYLEATGSGRVGSKRQEREDWLVLLGVNHLLAAMEAYVSAHLWDFPGDLTIQAAPGGVAGAVSVPVRLP